MKNSLRRLTALAALFVARAVIAEPAIAAGTQAAVPSEVGTGSAPAAVSRGTDQLTAGDRLVVEAASRLERRPSVTARLRHQTAIDGEQLYGVGSYWQQGTGNDLRVRLELQIGREISLSHVANG